MVKVLVSNLFFVVHFTKLQTFKFQTLHLEAVFIVLLASFVSPTAYSLIFAIAKNARSPCAYGFCQLQKLKTQAIKSRLTFGS